MTNQITKQEFIDIARQAALQFGYDVMDFDKIVPPWQRCAIEVSGVDINFTQCNQSNDVKTLLKIYITWQFCEFYLNQNKGAIDKISKCLIDIKARANKEL